MTNIVTTESGEKFTLFFTIRSPFSNFHPCRFTIFEDVGNGKAEERWYYSTEQYYMYHKALCAGDNETAEKIASERDARKIKMMSRNIKNFERETWFKINGDVMRRGNFAKYTQNPILRKKLFYTYGSTLVECSPTDIEWGIGLDINEPDALNPAKWRGKNRLGQILTEIREELWSNPDYAQEVSDILSMLENFDTFSRQFFAPPKRRSQQVPVHPPLDGNDAVDHEKRRSLPSSMDTDRSTEGSRDKRRSLPSCPCAERSENITDSVSRNLASVKVENGDFISHQERHSRPSSRSTRNSRYRRSPSCSRERYRGRSSSDDSKSRERNSSRLRRRTGTSSSSRSRYSTKSRHRKHRSSSGSGRESNRYSKKQRRSDGSDVNSSRPVEWRRRVASSSSDEESSSSVDGRVDQRLKKVLVDPFRSLLERLRSKQCGMWEQNAAEYKDGDVNGINPVDH